VSNAIKFTSEGGVEIHASLESAGEKECNFVCKITDTGIGIPDDKLVTIFDPFTQADASTTRVFGGTGLGLAICKKLCELMGGGIEVNSKEGQGSEFMFQIMLGKSQKEKPSPQELRPDSALKWSADTVILLVEDNVGNQIVAEGYLSGFGLKVIVADNGEEAIHILEESDKNTFALILMDCQMPVVDGYDATRTIRSRENAWFQNIPIVAMTANAMVGDREKCLQAGMNEYITKPVDEDALLSKLTYFLVSGSTGGMFISDDISIPPPHQS